MCCCRCGCFKQVNDQNDVKNSSSKEFQVIAVRESKIQSSNMQIWSHNLGLLSFSNHGGSEE